MRIGCELGFGRNIANFMFKHLKKKTRICLEIKALEM